MLPEMTAVLCVHKDTSVLILALHQSCVAPDSTGNYILPNYISVLNLLYLCVLRAPSILGEIFWSSKHENMLMGLI